MFKKVFALVFVFSFIVLFGTSFAGPNMNPGKWEITTKTEMAGMPPKSMTHNQCITADDLVPMSRDANQECQVTDIRTRGNTVFWKISCGGQGGKMNGTGSTTYNGNSMNGVMDMTIVSYGTKVKNILSGRRVGPCDGQSSAAASGTAAQAPQERSEVEETITEDTKDVGKAAKDEVKYNTINEVRKGIRSIFR